MSRRKFFLEFNGRAAIELDDKVISVVDDEWRKSLYNLNTSEEIASHVGFNLVINGLRLSSMDGWADQPDSNARLLNVDWDIHAKEAKP